MQEDSNGGPAAKMYMPAGTTESADTLLEFTEGLMEHSFTSPLYNEEILENVPMGLKQSATEQQPSQKSGQGTPPVRTGNRFAVSRISDDAPPLSESNSRDREEVAGNTWCWDLA